MLGWYVRFAPAPTVRTPALMQHPVGHLHCNRWQLQHLVRVVRRARGKRRVAAHRSGRSSWTVVGEKAPGDGPNDPVSRPLSGAWWQSDAGAASCRASPTTVAGGRSWNSAGAGLPGFRRALGADPVHRVRCADRLVRQPGFADSGSGSMTSPGSRQQDETDRHFIPKM